MSISSVIKSALSAPAPSTATSTPTVSEPIAPLGLECPFENISPTVEIHTDELLAKAATKGGANVSLYVGRELWKTLVACGATRNGVKALLHGETVVWFNTRENGENGSRFINVNIVA